MREELREKRGIEVKKRNFGEIGNCFGGGRKGGLPPGIVWGCAWTKKAALLMKWILGLEGDGSEAVGIRAHAS